MTFNHYHKGSSPLDLIKKKKEIIIKAEEFFKVTVYFLTRCVREGKSCKGYNVLEKLEREEQFKIELAN